VINVDGVGLKGARNTIAFFGCQQPLVDGLMARVRQVEALVEVEPWPQGDHMIFAMQGVPAIAISSEIDQTHMEQVIHTPADTVDTVDPRSIAEVVGFLRDVVRLIPGQ
jgi:aminopeptidase YwaD